MVYYSTPFRADRNIGKANNDFVKLLPSGAWVCITDGDAQFLLPDWGKHIEEIIDRHGSDFDLIGCITNRLGSTHQCYGGEFCENMDIMHHYEIAKELKENNGTDVAPADSIAGLCMIFSKHLWEKVGGFIERKVTADKEFNNSIKRAGGRIGIATGLYMFHSYRLDQHGKGRAIAQQDIKHLI